ncbi:MAG: hypothetical protein U9O56_09560 [Campylobacterota bacterium]|nr:hypothetical protein [Campylobacterota bacterium]
MFIVSYIFLKLYKNIKQNMKEQDNNQIRLEINQLEKKLKNTKDLKEINSLKNKINLRKDEII